MRYSVGVGPFRFYGGRQRRRRATAPLGRSGMTVAGTVVFVLFACAAISMGGVAGLALVAGASIGIARYSAKNKRERGGPAPQASMARDRQFVGDSKEWRARLFAERREFRSQGMSLVKAHNEARRVIGPPPSWAKK